MCAIRAYCEHRRRDQSRQTGRRRVSRTRRRMPVIGTSVARAIYVILTYDKEVYRFSDSVACPCQP
ncbi:hypothetical protein CYLTODRAFT_137031 [Cylindrobasidium torrendii FP15055 ss-10]|uniref:Uncharacterized protein n=1 Tax=Cylindrobasidium torrendii FP15055 ss-10 TaxID=1314674 RepID=A0A0D7AZV9_9AGAR|nr:hypothetical protein CYLTODRAFT_137031 [Cylindrobasidium torrendii FP15055 ss-10]